MGAKMSLPEDLGKTELAEKAALLRARKAAEQLAEKLDAHNAELDLKPLESPERFVNDMTAEFMRLLVHRTILR